VVNDDINLSEIFKLSTVLNVTVMLWLTEIIRTWQISDWLRD